MLPSLKNEEGNSVGLTLLCVSPTTLQLWLYSWAYRIKNIGGDEKELCPTMLIRPPWKLLWSVKTGTGLDT